MSSNGKILSRRQMKELREAFDLFDHDKNGAISISELKHVLIALNFKPNESLLEKVMKQMDTDRNGSVEFDEFVAVMGQIYNRTISDEEMRRAFQCFDIDQSGYITVHELHQVLQRLNPNISEQSVREVIRDIDTDRDGKISYAEFVRMLQTI